MGNKRAQGRAMMIVILLTAVGWLIGPAVFAETTTTPVTSSVSLDTKYPVLTGLSGEGFNFSVGISFAGADKQKFNVSVTAPATWTASVTTSVGTQAAVIQLGPSDTYGPATETLNVSLRPPAGKSPDPGDYKTTVTIDSGTLKQSIDLTARVTARYGLVFKTVSGVLSAEAQPGKDTHLALAIDNTGTAPVTNIALSSSGPSGWTVTFNPDKVDSLAPGYTQQVDLVINPPSGKTVAGDYAMSLSVQGSGNQYKDLDLRVTVQASSLWGWVSVILVLVVIAGLIVLFRVLGRR